MVLKEASIAKDNKREKAVESLDCPRSERV